PARVLVRPNVPEPCDGRGREPTSILAEQRCQRLLEPACGDPLEVEDRDQYLEAFRAARVRRQDRGAEGNALLARADPVTNARSAHRDRADAGHNLALGQVTVAHQPLTSIVGELVGVALEKPRHLRCDSLGQKRAGTAAQHLRQRVGNRAWLGELENITVGHGVSLLQEKWRREHPHDTPPYPFLPSPTFANSSTANRLQSRSSSPLHPTRTSGDGPIQLSSSEPIIYSASEVRFTRSDFGMRIVP